MLESPERPNEDTLRRFLLGSLSPGEAARVEGWLAVDPDAGAALDRVVAVDPLAAAVAVAGPRHDPDADTTRTGDGLGSAGHPTAAVAIDPTPPDARPGPHGEWGGYRVIGELGRGGMGVVYEAIDDRLGRRVALKVMAAGLAADPTARERFLREARAVAAVDHDNIVPVFQVGEHAGVPFIAMPRLAGATLSDRLADGPVPVAEAVEVARQVAAGLAAAHAAGLVHRDVKPSNLWLETRPDSVRRVRLLDFGLARAVAPDAQVTRSNQILGTPAFMAPEQGWGRPIDHRADLFSLGVVLYRMAVGVMPFQAPDSLALLSVVALKDPVRPRDANPAVPAALSELIMRLLAKEPVNRPASAADVVAELDRIAARLTDPAPAKARPRRGLLIALGVLAAGVLVALGGYVVIKVRAQDGKETTLRVAEGWEVTFNADGSITFGPPPQPKNEVPPKQVVPPIPPAALTERASAEWVLENGGFLFCTVPSEGNRRVDVRKRGDLPVQAFVADGVYLDGNAAGRLTDEAVSHLAGFTRVQTLFLDRQPLTDAGWERLLNLPGFRGLGEISLGDMNLTGRAIPAAARLPELGALLSRISVTRADELAPLKGCAKLKRLMFNVRGMPVSGYAHLRDLSLNLLGVGGNGAALPAEVLEAATSMPGLTALELSDWDCTRADLSAMRRLRYLAYFGSTKTEFSPDGLAPLAACPALAEVRIWLGKDGDAHLANLGKVPRLGTLMFNLSSTVTDAGLAGLHGTKSLNLIECWGCPKLTAAGIQMLSAAVPGCLIKSDHGAFKGGSRQPDSPAAPDKMAARREALAWLRGIKAEVHLLLPNGQWLVPGQIQEPLPPEFEIGKLVLRENVAVTDAGLKAHLAGFDGLRHLDVAACPKVTDDATALLVKLPKLKWLAVGWQPGVTHRTFSELAGHPELRTVVVGHIKLTDAAFAGFAAAPKLYQLNVNPGPDRTSVTAKGLAELQRSTSLHHLAIANTEITPGHLRAIGGIACLGGLELNQNRVPVEGFEAIAGLKNLTLLWLSETNVGDAHVRKLPPLATVKELSLKLCLVSDDGLAALEKWPALTTLTLQRTEVKGDGLTHLARCPKLEHVHLDGNPVSSAGLVALAASPTVRTLRIEGTPMTDAAADALATMPNLEWLHAVGSGVTERQCKALVTSASLARLGLSGPQVGDGHVKLFADKPRLTELGLLDTSVTDASFPVLRKLKQLTWLDLTGSRVTPAGIGALRKALPKCQVFPVGPDPVHITEGDRKALQWALDQGAEVGLAHFNDYGRGLTLKKSADEIEACEWADWLVPHHINFHRRPVLNPKSVENLRGLTHLINLGADGQPLADEWLGTLAELPLAGTLVSLGVSDTGLTDAGAKHLGAFPKLHGVYLSGNRLSGEGAGHLRKLPALRMLLWRETLTDDALKALKGLPLTELHTDGNRELTDAGVAHLAGFAELRQLSVGSSKLTDAGLARVLPSLTALTTLWVRHENLGPKTLAALGGCKSLEVLELAGWPLDGDGLAALRLPPTVARLTLVDVPGEVSDAALAHLTRQKQLKALFLPGAKLGKARAANLSKALPDTAVVTAEGEFANGVKK